MLKYVLASAFLTATPALAQLSVQQPMSLQDCVQSVQTAQASLALPQTTTVDTPDKKEMVITVPDGQITVTCDGVNNVATTTPN